jgi:hypothetical protein
MSEGVEIGSLIGTWVAAGVAVIALVGILGPLLVWRTIRTERHKAIDKLSQGGAESGGYVSNGIRVTSTIRLLRHFEAPNLHAVPCLRKPKLDWDRSTTLVTTNSASWIQFARTLECYHIEYTKTRSLQIRDGQVWLPVHRTWIIIIGIIGRYGRRKDNGKLIIRPAGGIASMQAKPGGHVTFASTPNLRKAATMYGGSTYNASLYGTRYKPLSGVTGSFQLCAPKNVVGSSYDSPSQDLYFSCHTGNEIGNLPEDPLDIVPLFWLAVGCLPAPGSKVYSLDDVESVPIEEEKPQRMMPQVSSYSMPAINEDQESDDELEYRPWTHNPMPYQPQSSSYNQYVVSSTAPEIDTKSKDARAFQFSTINHRVAELKEIADSINVEDTDQVYSLEEIKPTSDDMKRLKAASESTYVPTNFAWVRFRSKTSDRSNWFLRRSDAHILAWALLSTPMSPLGYLVGGDKSSRCRRLLCAASQSLFQLLIRLNNSLQALGLTGNDASRLAQLIETIYVRTDKMKRTRPYYEAIYDLDAALATRLHSDPRVNDAIGVLMLTNEEFRDLIAQSARHIEESINTSIVLDVANSTLNVPAVMGFVQRFPVELALLHPGLPTDDGPITITYCEVMFAALKACVRSTFLGTSLDSLPLFRTVLEMDTVVYIGSSQQ